MPGFPHSCRAAISLRHWAFYSALVSVTVVSPDTVAVGIKYIAALFLLSPACIICVCWYLCLCKIIVILSIKKYFPVNMLFVLYNSPMTRAEGI